MNARSERLTEFMVGGESRRVVFVETIQVRQGVECDVYRFEGTDEEDLGIIRVEEGRETPRQRVNLDSSFPIVFTEEGYVEGKGQLRIKRMDGLTEVYEVDPESGRFSVLVNRGDEMKWTADEGGLVAYEICRPPYRDGRYIDLD